MKHRFVANVSLLILILIFQAGCGQASPSTVTPPTDSTTPTFTETAPEPPAGGEPIEEPAVLIPPVLKPSLTISDEQGALSSTGITSGHVIGFTFPDGSFAIKAAAISEAFMIEDNLTVVGVVEIGKGAEKIIPGVYTVAIDLSDPTAEIVQGRLLPQAGEGTQRDIAFVPIPTQRNQERQEDPTVPSINPVIPSDATCFVIGYSNGGVAQTSTDVQSWYRFCSQASADTGELILSVRENFPLNFENLSSGVQTAYDHAMEVLKAEGLSQDEIRLDLALTISEIVGHQNILDCNNTQQCMSDLTGAPNILFWEQYDTAKSKAEGEDFAVTAAVAKIERQIDIPDQAIIAQGDYLVRFWFNQEDQFLGATFLGVTSNDQLILGQSVPATPAYFLDPEESRKMMSWISAWKLGRWCICQTRC